MRSLCLLILAAAPAFAAGPLGFGIKGGVPFNDFTNAVQSGQFNYTSSTQRYIVGPMVELRLPAGLSLELDALYRKFNYNSIGNAVDVIINSRTESNAWEFPLVLKYRFKAPVVRPYIEGGVAADSLQGLKQDITRTVIPTKTTTTTSTSSPTELHKSTTTGFVLGVGLDVKVLVIHISPEIRYTRWGAKHFLDANGGFGSNQNQAEFMVGISF
jgi:opacity protein-like surface antigen